MKKVIKFGVFMFFSLEHEPIHIHVIGKGGDAKFVWNGICFELLEFHKIKAGDMKKITKMIDDNKDIIINNWERFFKTKSEESLSRREKPIHFQYHRHSLEKYRRRYQF
ncbi:MAG: DUF4160 domain-containing protein [Bacteroidaceae bacterium]|nr:DUF4160 domain-containing protein [Bacteroidaceae bacterium]